MLFDAVQLNQNATRIPIGETGRQARVSALNRSCVVICVSAWEAYIEEVVRESLVLMRPISPPLGLWPALNATVRGQLGRFNTPNTENIRLLMSDALGLQNVHHAWSWQNCTHTQTVHRLAFAMELRHQIAHGVNPRPVVDRIYANQLLDFFQRLARCTDRAIRNHLVTTLGILNPWPP